VHFDKFKDFCQQMHSSLKHKMLQLALKYHTPHSTQYTQHILPQHSNNFKDVFLLIISTKTVTLARFRRMLPDDGTNGPKHLGAI
jgi:hypothetical protein